MNPHHEHEFEAAPGLPEALPAGERVLWQGAPEASLLAVHALHVRKLAVYFAGMLMVQALYLLGEPQVDLLRSVSLSAVLAVACLLMLRVVAWYAARNTLYTLTNRRVVMRIGMVLTITLNIPLKRIEAASVRHMRSGAGDIALALNGKERLGWLHLWPHAKAWTFRKPEPALRCVPAVDQLAAQLLSAWQAENPHAQAQVGEQAAMQAHAASSGQPAMQMS